MSNSSNAQLKDFTSLRIGGNANIVAPSTIAELKNAIIQYPNAFILGGGTKVLFPDDGITEPVIVTTKLTNVEEKYGEFIMGAGVRLANHFDFVTGVAATAGGAVRNNFGAFGFEIGPFVKRVHLISATEDVWVERRDLEFSYRNCSLQQKPGVIAEVAFMRTQTTHKDTYLRQRKEKQPLALANAGSIFKNPPGQSAGQLIEACGLKGSKEGDAVIWDKHANFIINTGDATAQNVIDLMKKMYSEVKKKYSIKLQPELQVYGGINFEI